MPARKWLAALALTTTLAGCSTVASKDLRTSGVTAHMTVAVGDGGVDVRVQLSAGGLTTVDLGDGDRLDARSGSRTTQLHRTRLLGVDTYAGRLDRLTGPGTRVTVAFDRPSRDTSAPRSVVALPPAVRVSSPRREARVSRARDLEVGVNRADGSIRVAWTGSCVAEGTGLDFAAGRPVIIPAGSIRIQPAASSDSSAVRPPRSGRCLVTLTVTRIVVGTLDPAYSGGQIVAERSVAMPIRSVP